jgi:hypothetical protein
MPGLGWSGEKKKGAKDFQVCKNAQEGVLFPWPGYHIPLFTIPHKYLGP